MFTHVLIIQILHILSVRYGKLSELQKEAYSRVWGEKRHHNQQIYSCGGGSRVTDKVKLKFSIAGEEEGEEERRKILDKERERYKKLNSRNCHHPAVYRLATRSNCDLLTELVARLVETAAASVAADVGSQTSDD